MKKYFQRLGSSLMLPVAVLPAAALLLGIGYAIDPSGWGGGSPVAAFLIKAGGSIIDNMAILFAVGVALGMAKERDGSAGLSGLVAYLVITTLLSTNTVAMIKGVDPSQVNAAFGKIQNQFIGIMSGLVAASMYNRFSEVKLPDALAFFSGKRLVPIVTSAVMLVVSGIFYFIWPIVYSGLVAFGEAISGLGFIGAGLYGFFNRLLIPVGLHHALNSVFWFDVANINDIGNFWAGTGVKGVTGMYQAGFFPIMMFGLIGAAFAIYKTAKPERKKEVGSLMFAAGFASFLTGVTEPLEFSFMFVAPGLYIVHAALTGLSLAVSAFFHWTAGFGFSAGLIDFVLSSRLPLANKPYMLLVQGLIFGLIYYELFKFLIVKFNIATPGREPLEAGTEQFNVELNGTDAALNLKSNSNNSKYATMASIIYEGLGEDSNIVSIENCITRLRVEVKDINKVDQGKIKKANIPGVKVTGPNNIQVIVGPQVQFVAEEIEKLRK
ncbi:MAG TPA: PTS glucose transporter subunit IIBC [Clostridiaceae bacterium]|jgi:PTS system N-acetylglucosamine-specific IIC component|nr:PTS glucose transporter subunit IIBC [Clostridiaceae bacterium]HBF77083.1 PTS glucose transporter subunit IIBC [Clostridiaceae bacterium]HBG39300.1 PTS glucose transporter subunit IIBC [Clostridiaceae bacterium]HBN28563.1 PTS glucose transporter subunit IIBC [Clostridiaceae bacterium]HBX48944.1 PTS glucose transporter subunit IIBC [Clostridiaceae bacterium]